MTTIAADDIKAVLAARHSQPHAFFGLHANEQTGYLEARTFQPGAVAVSLVDKGTGKVVSKLTEQSDSGVFAKTLRRKRRFDYLLKVCWAEGEQLLEDPLPMTACSATWTSTC